MVREQEDPLQEEHREGPGGGQHVRRQSGRGGGYSRRVPRPDDVPRQPVGRESVLRRWTGVWRLLNTCTFIIAIALKADLH